MQTRDDWHPAWWKAEIHGSAWQLVKEAMRRDWQQTKHDLGIGGHELNQQAIDTVLQAGGDQRVPPIDVPNPPQIIGDWNEVESSMDYGYSARREYGAQHPRWTPQLEAKLKEEWIAAQRQATHDWQASVAHVRRAYEFQTAPTMPSAVPVSPMPGAQPATPAGTQTASTR